MVVQYTCIEKVLMGNCTVSLLPALEISCCVMEKIKQVVIH